MTVWSLLVVALALGAGALSKGATGLGLPLIALPLLASFFGVPHAIAVLAVPIIATNAWQVWHYRSSWPDVRFLPRLVVTGIVGIIVGTIFLKNIPADGVALTLGLLLAAYVTLRLARPHLGISQSGGHRIAPGAGLLAGTLQGMTGLSGPVLITFLHSLKLERDRYIFAISVMFLLFSLVQLPALAVAGLLTRDALLEGVFALLPVALMMPVGTWLARRMNRESFDRIILAILAGMAIWFIWQGATGR